MKIYVDEEPNKCKECPLYGQVDYIDYTGESINGCRLTGKRLDKHDNDGKLESCMLKQWVVY